MSYNVETKDMFHKSDSTANERNNYDKYRSRK